MRFSSFPYVLIFRPSHRPFYYFNNIDCKYCIGVTTRGSFCCNTRPVNNVPVLSMDGSSNILFS
jgi:hypothetical protein